MAAAVPGASQGDGEDRVEPTPTPAADRSADRPGAAVEPTATALLEPTGEEARYDFDAFSSYARDPDEALVETTKGFLESVHELRVEGVRYLAPLRIWVDRLSLAVRHERRDRKSERATLTPPLRQLLDEELARCKSLIVYCSESATRSTWVNYEVDWWLARERGPIWLVVTEGVDPARFPEQVFPKGILDRKLHEAVWYDFRGARDRSRRRSYERARVNLAADLYSLDQERLAIAVALAERRRRALRVAAGLAIALLLAVAVVASWRTTVRGRAIDRASEARLALAGEGDAAAGVRLALEAQDTGWFDVPEEAEATLRAALAASRLRARFTAPAAGRADTLAAFPPAPLRGAGVAPAAAPLAVVAGDAVWAIDARRGGPIGKLPLQLSGSGIGIALAASGRRLAAATQDDIRVWDLGDDGWQAAAPPVREGQVKLASFDLSPDGRWLAAGTQTGGVQVWSLADGDARLVLDSAHVPEASRGTPVFSVAFSHDGRLLASASDDGRARLWRLADGAWTRGPSVEHGAPGTKVLKARFSPDDRLLATSGSDRSARLWALSEKLDAPVAVATFSHPTAVCDAQVALDGDLLVAMDVDGNLFFWQTSRPERRALKVSALAGSGERACTVALSPDGETVATAGQDEVVRLWQVDVLADPEVMDLAGEATALAVAPSGGSRSAMAAARSGDIAVWRGDSGATVSLSGGSGDRAAPPREATGGVAASLALTPDGRIAAAGGGGGVEVWDARAGSPWLAPMSFGAQIADVAIDDAGERIAAISDRKLYLISLPAIASPGLRPRTPFVGVDGGEAVAFAPGTGAIVAVTRDRLVVWDREQIAAGQGPRKIEAPGIRRAAFSAGHGALLTESASGLQAWRTSGPERVGEAIAIAAPPDATEVSERASHVAAAVGKELLVWDPASGTRVARLVPAARVQALAFDRGETLLAAGEADGRVEVWEVPGGALVATLLPEDPAAIRALRFTPDGRHLAIADRKGRIRVHPLEAYAPHAWLVAGPALAAERSVRELLPGGRGQEESLR